MIAANNGPDMEENSVTLRQLRELARTLRATTLHCIELKSERWSVRMTRTPSPLVIAPATCTEPTAASTPLCAPAPGQLLLRHPLLEQNFALEGMQVAQHQLLALLKVGPLYLPLRSPVAGRVISFAVSHDDTVEYGSEILRIHGDNPHTGGL